MPEYKIISETAAVAQKLLNQWKHEFKLDVLKMSIDGGVVVILLTREKRETKPNANTPKTVLKTRWPNE